MVDRAHRRLRGRGGAPLTGLVAEHPGPSMTVPVPVRMTMRLVRMRTAGRCIGLNPVHARLVR